MRTATAPRRTRDRSQGDESLGLRLQRFRAGPSRRLVHASSADHGQQDVSLRDLAVIDFENILIEHNQVGQLAWLQRTLGLLAASRVSRAQGVSLDRIFQRDAFGGNKASR